MARTWARCADSMLWEAANRAAGQAPVLDDYVANRATAGATYLALMLNEGLAKYELPDILHQCGPLSALRALAGDHICWVNDLLSLEREEQRGDVHNLVLVLERTFGYGRARAVAEAVRMANERMTAIGLLADQIPAYQSAAGLPAGDCRLLDRAADDLLHWLAGSMDFHRLSTRHIDHRAGHGNPFWAGDPDKGSHARTR